ncbi:MAG: GNAT family N-acetyltransferase [Muribaculaceae bacterium]|nr:GNAT family N-acetyltransferase [Muribaculaceae bacterium]
MEGYYNIPVDDVKGVTALWQNVFHDSPDFIQRYLQLYAIPNNYVVERDNAGEIIGMAHCPVIHDKYGNSYTYLYAVAVAPEYRGKGIASRLIHEVISKSTTDFIATIPASESLQKWYHDNFGFVYPDLAIALPEDDGFDLGTGDSATDIFMVKFLNTNDYETKR